MTPNSINHPRLGIIKAMGPKSTQWTTGPLTMGAFGYTVPIKVLTDGGQPSERQIGAMLSIFQASTAFKESVAGCMLEQYTKYERPAYRKQIGDSRYTLILKESDIPEITEPSGMWALITGMLPVIIDEEANLALAFNTTFDLSHEFAVRFRDGELYEVMMDG